MYIIYIYKYVYIYIYQHIYIHVCVCIHIYMCVCTQHYSAPCQELASQASKPSQKNTKYKNARESEKSLTKIASYIPMASPLCLHTLNVLLLRISGTLGWSSTLLHGRPSSRPSRHPTGNSQACWKNKFVGRRRKETWILFQNFDQISFAKIGRNHKADS